MTCLASIRDSLLSSNFFRFSAAAAAATAAAAAPEAETLARSMDPVSLKPEPLLGFLRDPKKEILGACNHIERDANVTGRNPAPT